MKKASRPEPQSMGANALAPAAAPVPVIGDPPAPNEWRERIYAAMIELGMKFTADAIEHSEVVQSGNELQFTTPPQFSIYMQESEIQKAIQHVAGKPMRIKVKTGSVSAPAVAKIEKQEQEDDTKRRALENPEVQRFREVFGGEVRNVRNLKE
jgi:hypothetical protein